ncbi:MAG TPA: ergothioneine biosynthesis protein EgtB [Candidatus Angelobacter sp.]|nr:ergothioneine biosynthesis protein EgtB [Candidatus Angelobacter sp.]
MSTLRSVSLSSSSNHPSTVSDGNDKAGDTLLDRYNATRDQTDWLTAKLTPEDQMVQSCPDASPSKWHLAHTSWFFETFVLSRHLADYRPFHPDFRNLFNSYYNGVGPQPQKALRNTFSRPGLEEIQAYRRYVDEHVAELLASLDHDGTRQGLPLEDDPVGLVELGINHEQQHQELLITDIKHAFWVNPLQPAFQPLVETITSETAAQAQQPHTYTEGVFEVGVAAETFHFDNESPRHKVYLQPFRFAKRLVTCGEYAAFIEDQGYERPALWLSDGWKAVQAQGWRAPLYWEQSGGEWFQFTCSGLRKIHEHEPVCHVSYYEADAFARWAGARLPNEFEWEVAGSSAAIEGNLLESGRFHPAAAPATAGEHPLQIFGDVWEWTASAYVPYPGYKPLEGPLGEYNGKFMCNQITLRGGSCVTPRSHIRASYRNFFPPETRWQFSGIRLADDIL